jgi:Uncharacterized conserved protein
MTTKTWQSDVDAAELRVVHDDGSERRRLANRVEVADSELARKRGMMFRRSVPDRYAMMFPFGGVDDRKLNMLFVPFALDAVWTVNDEVSAVKRLSPWTGRGSARADVVFELSPGVADGVAVGDEVRAVEQQAEVVQ